MLTAFAAHADTETVGGYTWTYEINGDTAVIYKGSSSPAISPSPTGDVTIPSTLGGKTVTSIGDYAFYHCSGLTSVTIPDSVTSIGDYAFYDCSGLTSVTIPDSVTSIGDGAFSYCSGLVSISVDSGNANYKSVNGLLLSKDGKTLILGVNGDVTIPDGVTSIGSSAFEGCSGLTSVTIPNSVTSIGRYAFEDCSGLTHVTIPNSVTSIGDGAFSYCSGLTSATIGNSVTSIGDDAFWCCSGLTSVTIPDSVTSIGDCAFRDCSGLTNITFDGNAPALREDAFYGVTSSCTVYVRRGSTGWGVTIPGTWNGMRIEYSEGELPAYGTPVFTIEDGVLTAVDLNGATEVVIPDGVTSIGDGSFKDCSGLTSVTIPNSVTSIGEEAFLGCIALTSVMIPNNVTNIGDFAFGACTNMTSVTIPDSVKSIGQYAFAACLSLKTLTIPDGVEEIGGYAFMSCVGLESVTIGAGLRDWNQPIYPIFKDCTNVTEVVLRDGLTNIGGGALLYFNIASLTVPASVTNIGVAVFNGYGSLTEVTFEGDAPHCDEIDAGDGQVVTLWNVIWGGGSEDACNGWVAHVKRGTSGWDDDGNGLWQQMRLEWYGEIPQCFVTFDANGGVLGGGLGALSTISVTNGCAVVTLPTAMRDGYTLDGWFTKPDVGSLVSPETIVTTNVTFYAHWTEIPPPPPPDSGELDVRFAKAQTVDGALYKGDALVGTVQVKVGKISKKGVVKVSATASLLLDGKVKKITAKAVNVTLDAQKRVPPTKVVFKEPIGEMAFEMAADGSFTLKNGSYLMAEAKIGGALNGGSYGTFSIEDFNFSVPGILLDGLLPDCEPFEVSRGKWKFAKAATVKWAKPKKGAEHSEFYEATSGKDLIVDDTKGKTNLSGLKLTYTAKTGQFKGSFKVYALQDIGANWFADPFAVEHELLQHIEMWENYASQSANQVGKKKKLVKYTVNVIGFVVDGVGYGEASCKKPAGTWAVTVE